MRSHWPNLNGNPSERYAQLTADNAGGSFAGTVKVTGVKNNVGPAGEDAVTEITRGVFLPQTPERFTYDADGNLTGDAKWTYTWDGENRLSRMETKASALVAGISGGLLGKYYNYTAGTVWSGPPALTRVEAVDFDWGEGSPGAGVGADQFNVLWTGAVEAPVTGDYLFETQSDDGAELWLNGTVLFSNWGLRNGVSTLTSGAIHLEAGQRYPIVVYYFNASGPAVMRLRWRKPGEAVLQAIPAENLYHQSADQAPRRLELAYDYQGRRVAKKVSVETNAEWTVQSDLRHLYDGWNLLAELNATDSNAPVRTYVWGLDLSGSLQGAGGVGGLLLSNLGSATYAPAFDGNGNVIGLVDMATGAKSATYEYGAFGETLIADGPTAELFPFRFSTKFTDSETGLLYYGLRYYSPSTGRWPSRDPIEEQGGVNLYRFVQNDPVDLLDPKGLVVLQGFLGAPVLPPPLVVRVTLEWDQSTDASCCKHIVLKAEAEAGIGAGAGVRLGKFVNLQLGIMLAGVGRKEELDITSCPNDTGHIEYDRQLLNFSKFLSQGLGLGAKKIGIEAGVSIDTDIEASISIHVLATKTAANISLRAAGYVDSTGGAGLSAGDYNVGSSNPKQLGHADFNATLLETTIRY